MPNSRLRLSNWLHSYPSWSWLKTRDQTYKSFWESRVSFLQSKWKKDWKIIDRVHCYPLTFMEKRPSKFDPETHGSFSSLSVFDPTNMTYKPTPKTSMAVPTRNMSDQTQKSNESYKLSFISVELEPLGNLMHRCPSTRTYGFNK